MSGANICVVDDDAASREALAEMLEKEGYNVFTAPDAASCLSLMEQKSLDAVVADLVMPRMTGIELLRRCKELDPAVVVIMVTGYGSVETAVDAMREGAFHYLTKPIRPGYLRELLRKALAHRRLIEENERLKDELRARETTSSITGTGPKMQRILELVQRVAPTTSTVLITGESGTGKEVIADAIQACSSRSDAPYVKVDCAALMDSLLESELFGHVKGAFTGAYRDKPGKLELADGGTILLDEIGEMSLATQTKLLRFLQDGTVERVGDTRRRKLDVRVIAATNKNLEEAVERGEFRKDLYYRLKVVRLELPPLRERREDIPLLVERFLDEFSRLHGRRIEGVSPEAMEMLRLYSWPGNVRELRNCMEGLVVTSVSSTIGVEDLPSEIREAVRGGSAAGFNLPVGMTLEDVEKEMIRQTLESTGWNRTRAARILGVSLRTLQRKIKQIFGDDGK